MAKLTSTMKELIGTQQCFLATADRNGQPNIAPKGSVIVVDDETLAFGEMVGKLTYQNLKDNPQVAVAVADRSSLVGYRFNGQAIMHGEGSLYDRVAAIFTELGMPKPNVVIEIKVTEIFDLSVKNPGVKVS